MRVIFIAAMPKRRRRPLPPGAGMIMAVAASVVAWFFVWLVARAI